MSIGNYLLLLCSTVSPQQNFFRRLTQEEQQSNYVVMLRHANYIIRHDYIFFIRPKNYFLKAVRLVTLTKVRERRKSMMVQHTHITWWECVTCPAVGQG